MTCLPRTPHVTSNTLDWRPGPRKGQPAGADRGGPRDRAGRGAACRGAPHQGSRARDAAKCPRRGRSRPITPSAPSRTRTGSSSRLWKRGSYVVLPVLLPDGDLDWASYEGPDSLAPGPTRAAAAGGAGPRPGHRGPRGHRSRTRACRRRRREPARPGRRILRPGARPGRRPGADDRAALRRRTAAITCRLSRTTARSARSCGPRTGYSRGCPALAPRWLAPRATGGAPRNQRPLSAVILSSRLPRVLT